MRRDGARSLLSVSRTCAKPICGKRGGGLARRATVSACTRIGKPRLVSRFRSSYLKRMKIIALEEHFILPRDEQSLPPGAHRVNDREKLLGFDVVAALLDVGERRMWMPRALTCRCFRTIS